MAFAVAATTTLDKPIFQDLDSWSSTGLHDLGYKVHSDDGDRTYVYSFLSSNMTAMPGATYPAFFLAGGQKSGQSVTSTFQSDLGLSFAGIFCALAAAGNNYGWVQTTGYVASGYLSSCVAVGDNLTPAIAGFLSPVGTGAISTSVAGVTYALANLAHVGEALEADTSGKGDYILLDR